MSLLQTREATDEIPDVTGLPPALTREVSMAARVMVYAPGEVVARIGERGDPGVVHEGLLRHSIRSDDGRRVTLRYIRKGESFGVEALFVPLSHVVVAVSHSRVAHYDRIVLEQLMQKHPVLSLKIARRLAESTRQLDEAAGTAAFMTVAQRVVYHLAAVAEPPRSGGAQTVVRLSQQELADAVGSVREVVARVIRDMRARHIVQTSRHGISIVNELALLRYAADQS
jgi:CRP/FNR family transcriptional regulator, cyclic AMP receptor protein